MKQVRVLMAIAMLAMGLFIGGCGGGEAKVQAEQKTQSSTLGQELMDLEASYNKGIISESEYLRLKRKIIEERTK